MPGSGLNQRFDAKYLASTIELDSTKSAALLKEASDIFQADPPWLGIVTGTAVAAYGKTVRIPNGIPGDYWPLFDTISRTK